MIWSHPMTTTLFQGQRYDREKWRAQLNPILELWSQLLSASGGALSKRSGVVARDDKAGRDKAGGSGDGSASKTKPIEDFIDLESELAAEVCGLVDASLGALKKVLFGSGLLTPGIQVASSYF